MKAKIDVDREIYKDCILCPRRPQNIDMDVTFNASGIYPVMVKEQKGCNVCIPCIIACPELAIKAYREENEDM